MSHNIPLPTHRYVHVRSSFVLDAPEAGPTLPAVWWGVSSSPGRALGCHVLLENGALVLDLPPHAVALSADAPAVALPDVQPWDCFGWAIEAVEVPFLDGLPASLLDAAHHATGEHGRLLGLGFDWTANGYSAEPEQHKMLWVVAHADGSLRLLPQDRLLVEDRSFTLVHGVPRVQRQRAVWRGES